MLGLGSSLVTGGVTQSPIGYAIQFDGANDYCSIPYDSALAPTAAITFSCWVNLDAEFGGGGWYDTVNQAPIDASTWHPCQKGHFLVGNIHVGGYGIRIIRGGTKRNPKTEIRADIRVSDIGDGSANYKTALWGGAVDTTGSTTLHEIKDFSGWIHLACTFDGATFLLYIKGSNDLNEGAVDTSGEQTQSTGGTGRTILYNAANSSMKIGADTNGASETGFEAATVHEGSIDEVAIWNTALSSANINAIYNSGTPGIDLTDSSSYDSDVTTNLVGYWKMDEGEGTTVADSSSNSNTLTLRNGTEFAAMY